MIKNICSVIGLKLMRKKQDGFWTKLVKEDTNVSVMNFFLMATLGVGVLLLFIPVVAMVVDLFESESEQGPILHFVYISLASFTL